MVLRILNLGAGVQSSAVLLMGLAGELPLPDHAIFADTGWEPAEVYSWLDWLEMRMRPAGVPLHRVSAGNLRQDVLDGVAQGKRIASPPLFTQGSDGKAAPINRSCTTEYKIRPIVRKTRELLGLPERSRWPRGLVCETWLGISGDEVRRMKISPDPWQRFWHPLVEHEWPDEPGGRPRLRTPMLTRQDCLAWIKARGEPTPPRSACIGCPYHSNEEWRHIRNDPTAWADAVAFDKALRAGEVHGLRGKACYLHRSLRPLDEAPIERDAAGQLNLFDNECSGVCGV